MYHIQPYTYDRATKLGIKIAPSHREGKKIDIYDWNGNYIFSIGDRNYSDFPTYVKTHGMEYALQRRRLYHLRHKKDAKILGSKGYYSRFLLW
jgi:hypothetical protein